MSPSALPPLAPPPPPPPPPPPLPGTWPARAQAAPQGGALPAAISAPLGGFFAKPDGFGADAFDRGAVARLGGATATSGATTAARLLTESARVVVKDGWLTKLGARAAWLAAPIAAVTNWLDYRAGKLTAQERNTLIAADAVGYTAAGFAGTLVATAVGATGGLGILVGLAAGAGASWLYERFARPRFDDATTVDPWPLPK